MSRGAGKSQRHRRRNPSGAQIAAVQRARNWEEILKTPDSDTSDRADLLAAAAAHTEVFYIEIRGLTTRGAGSLSIRATQITKEVGRNYE